MGSRWSRFSLASEVEGADLAAVPPGEILIFASFYADAGLCIASVKVSATFRASRRYSERLPYVCRSAIGIALS